MQLNNKDIEEIKLGNIDCIAAYLGTNKVFAKDLGVYTSFSSSILPTVWEKTSNTTATGTNSYGTWKIRASSTWNETTGVELAFDNDLTTCAKSSNYRNDYIVTITCPSGVTICPTRFSITEYRMGADDDGNTIKGDGVVLVNIGEDFYDIDEPKTKTYSVAGSQYFSQIQLTMTSHKNGYIRQLYNFEITRGTVRVEK